MQPTLIMMDIFIQIHSDIFFWLHSFSFVSEKFNFLLYLIAQEIDLYIVFFGIIFVVIHHHARIANKPEFISRTSLREGLFTVVSVLIAWGVSYLMKIIFLMPRPFIRFSSDVIHLFPYGGFDSFPSGHATLFAALATALYLRHKKIGILFWFLAISISVARVISGVHFPIDILVGWILGTLVVISVNSIFRKK